MFGQAEQNRFSPQHQPLNASTSSGYQTIAQTQQLQQQLSPTQYAPHQQAYQYTNSAATTMMRHTSPTNTLLQVSPSHQRAASTYSQQLTPTQYPQSHHQRAASGAVTLTTQHQQVQLSNGQFAQVQINQKMVVPQMQPKVGISSQLNVQMADLPTLYAKDSQIQELKSTIQNIQFQLDNAMGAGDSQRSAELAARMAQEKKKVLERQVMLEKIEYARVEEAKLVLYLTGTFDNCTC
jgi:hypothetical protein